MNLKQLLPVLEYKELKGDSDPLVVGITQDSRLVQPGFVFVCICGYQQDGHDYIEEAVNRGAVVIVVEKDISGRNFFTFKDSFVWVRVKDSREALALLSSTFYQNPSQKMRIIGITGTNGKTTTTYLVASILEASGFSVGLINTLTCRIKGVEVPSVRTTPESVDLQKALARMVEKGCQYAVVEVSSHSLVLKRVLGCEFDVGVWTNITPDHLDFHRTFSKYQKAKQRLFLSLEGGKKSGKAAVLNMDDPSYSMMEKSTSAPIFSFGLQKKAQIRAEKIIPGMKGMNFEVHGLFGQIKMQTDLGGIYNVSNILAAIGVGLAEKINIDKIQLGIRKVSHIPGRFETIACGQDFWVVVDFAHTPDALNRLLDTARRLQPGRIITVFGCGGDRDKMKRFPMGRIAATLSDYIIITTDNTRSEDPMSIARQVEEGVCSIRNNERSKDENREISKKYEIILDRYKAIERAVSMAKSSDMVVIAGKGHEQYQTIGSKRIPFDDRQVAGKILHKRKPAYCEETI